MSKIADGILFALEQSKAERDQQKTAEIASQAPVDPALMRPSMGAQVKQAAQVFLADNEEDVTVGDLQTLMQAFR